ncbi:MAG: glutamine amidotransferase [Planctomycetes bacterium DG_23]|nr:MAG: glutamine amidotransferase [Planctomycetes bacterium DG_23]
MSLEGKKVVVLAEDDYEDLELWYPALRLREAGAEVTIAGPAKKHYKSKHGYPAASQAKIVDLNPEDYDGVIVPGGYAPDKLRRHKEVLDFVKAMNDAGKPVAAICHGGWVPVSAGIVSGKRMTCYVAIKDDVQNAGAKYVDEPVVTDGNLITSRFPDDLPHFCKAIIAALGG